MQNYLGYAGMEHHRFCLVALTAMYLSTQCESQNPMANQRQSMCFYVSQERGSTCNLIKISILFN